MKDTWLQLRSQLVFGPTKYCTIIATRVEAINKLEQKLDRLFFNQVVPKGVVKNTYIIF